MDLGIYLEEAGLVLNIYNTRGYIDITKIKVMVQAGKPKPGDDEKYKI